MSSFKPTSSQNHNSPTKTAKEGLSNNEGNNKNAAHDPTLILTLVSATRSSEERHSVKGVGEGEVTSLTARVKGQINKRKPLPLFLRSLKCVEEGHHEYSD